MGSVFVAIEHFFFCCTLVVNNATAAKLLENSWEEDVNYFEKTIIVISAVSIDIINRDTWFLLLHSRSQNLGDVERG